MPGGSAPSGFGTSISVSSVRVSGLQRVGDARHLAGKAAIRASPARAPPPRRPGATPNGLVLRHVDLRADHVGLHHREHEGAAGGVGLHQAADVDIALGDDAVERRDARSDSPSAWLQHPDLRLLRRDI